MELPDVFFVASKFFMNAKIEDINLISEGNINETYLVSLTDSESHSKFILQKISKIFNNPERMIQNHELVTRHLFEELKKNDEILGGRSFSAPFLLPCEFNDQKLFHFNGENWRAMNYVDSSYTIDSLDSLQIAKELGFGLAVFHELLSGIKLDKISTVINHFHDLDYYLRKYQLFAKKINNNRFSDIALYNRVHSINSKFFSVIDRIRSYMKKIDLNINRKFVIHGDPKLSNFMFNVKDNRFSPLIDFDTISVNYLILDLADCLRSACNLGGEDSMNFQAVSFNLDFARSILEGYLSVSNNLLTLKELCLLPEFVYLITFELGIRFLTDFLDSNSYFNIEYYSHNLYRAEVQFKLLEDITLSWDDLQKLLRDFI